MQMLGITLSIRNTEICYISIPVYYDLAILTVFNNNAFTAHTTKPFNQDA